jgi:nucleotide-binding universal stress UspA family protein
VFTKILVPLDRSALAEQALGRAAALAPAAHAKIDLALVHEPLEFAGYRSGAMDTEEWNVEHRYLEAVAAELHSRASVPVTHAVLRGGPADMICARVKDVGADLVVMTSHGRTGLSRTWLGSVADAVVRCSSTPVLMLRPVEPIDRFAEQDPFARVLVPLDGSRLALGVLDAAAALAQCGDATLLLLRVVQPVPLASAYEINQPFLYPPIIPDEEATTQVVGEVTAELETIARSLRESGTRRVEVNVVVGGRVADDVTAFARQHDVDVIAMSTRGRGASRILLGSVADKLLRASTLPILLYRPADTDDDESHVTEADVAAQLPALPIP